jgi:N-methylhydantoinase B
MQYDPVRVWLYHELLTAVPEEMGQALERAAYSPNIKERRDYSCALFDVQGRMIAQAAHIPVHLGAMPILMAHLLNKMAWEPGDMVLTNDPYSAGTHLPDWTLVAPVFLHDTLAGFVANRAHHADTGGSVPGSMPLAREIFEEGLRIPPVKLLRRGEMDEDLLQMLLANVRTSRERMGDLYAQMGANRVGMARFLALLQQEGLEVWQVRFDELISYSEQVTRNLLRAIPAGDYEFEDWLDEDGRGTFDILIRVKASLSGDGSVRFDFTGSAKQCNGGVNATEAVTRSACYYVVRCLATVEVPTNEGCWHPVEVIAPPGTVVNPLPPAAVAGGNVETSQRLVDVLFGALSKALPDRIPAASQGSMNNVLFGGYDAYRNRPFAYYETIGGGSGACPESEGTGGLHSHMTNTRNTPVEALETAYPVRVLEYRLADGTGGKGLHRGGDGVKRVFQFLCETTLTLFTERRKHAPYGLNGGKPGERGANLLQLSDGSQAALSKGTLHCPAGTVLIIRTPGGGGWGREE